MRSWNFNPRSPRGERHALHFLFGRTCYFNPRSPRGERRVRISAETATTEFQSTLPARGATLSPVASLQLSAYFNPRSPRGERPNSAIYIGDLDAISIHAPREGSDAVRHRHKRGGHSISIHAPREGSDRTREAAFSFALSFQSTLPARGATLVPRGKPATVSVFQSTLHARGATGINATQKALFAFQSTLPARGATIVEMYHLCGCEKISIHAPREGSDPLRLSMSASYRDFNPRSPRGERRWRTATLRPEIGFQSTLPARGATVATSNVEIVTQISIHAPREGSDP